MMTRTIDWRQHGLVRRTERVDTARMLQIAEAYTRLVHDYTDEQIAELLAVPVQGNVSAVERLLEATRTRRWWLESSRAIFRRGTRRSEIDPNVGLLALAVAGDAAWNSLAEPPRWDDVDPVDVFEFVHDHVRRTGRWPLIDDMRRRFGRRTTRPVGDVPGQETLI